MKNFDNEQDLVTFAKHQLDKSVQRIDVGTQARLRQSRHQAIHNQPKRTSWVWPAWGFATVSAAVLAITLWVPELHKTNAPIPPLEDLDLLASADFLDLYEDLEFYGWLAEGDHAS